MRPRVRRPTATRRSTCTRCTSHNARGAANGCAMADCHDVANTGIKPTAKSCGTGGDCHTTDPHNLSVHTTTSSSECVDCHGSTDLKVVHGEPVRDLPQQPDLSGSHRRQARVRELSQRHRRRHRRPTRLPTRTTTSRPPTPPRRSLQLPRAVGEYGDGTVPTGGKECSTCHSSTLKTAHADDDRGRSHLRRVPHEHGAGRLDGHRGQLVRPTSASECHDTGAATAHDGYTTPTPSVRPAAARTPVRAATAPRPISPSSTTRASPAAHPRRQLRERGLPYQPEHASDGASPQRFMR